MPLIIVYVRNLMITFMNEDKYDEEIEEVNPDEMLSHDEICINERCTF